MFYSTTNRVHLRHRCRSKTALAPQNETDRVIVLALSRSWQSPEGSSTEMLGLYDLLQRQAAANDQSRALGMHQLFLLEFGEQPAHGLAGRTDDLGDLFVRQGQLYLRGSIRLRRLRGPREQQLRKFL